jgi:transposase
MLCDNAGHPLHFELTAGQTHEAAAFDADAYRDRNIVERLIGWLKECRRVFSRFEKTAKNFAGMIRLAFIQRYLRTT